MPQHEKKDEEFSFKNYFVPLTTLKVVHFIIFIGLIVYCNSLFNGFVGDDFGQLVDNNIVHNIKNIPQFFLGGTFNNGNGAIIGLYYKPLLLTTYSLLYSLYGANSFPYHLFQLTLHICNAIFVFILFKKFFNKNIAFFLSIIFLVHPINTEAVANIASLQDTLFTFFGLLASSLLLLNNHKTINIILVNFCLFLALFSKETGIIFVPIILIYCFLFDRKNFKSYLITTSLLTFFYILLHLSIVGVGFSKNQPFPIMRLNLLERMINIPSIIIHYLKTFIFPIHLAIGHQWVIKNVNFLQFYLPFIITLTLLGSFGAWIYASRKNVQNLEEILFFGIWFGCALLLHLQIIPLDFTVADRWFYLPMIGLLGLLGIILNKIKIKNKTITKVVFLLFAIYIILLSSRTMIRNADWKNGITLAEHDIQYASESYSLENYLGTEYYNIGKYDEAQKHFARSTELAPYWDYNWNYLGLVLEKKGNLKGDKQLLNEARIKYQIAIKNSVSSDAPYINMSRLLIYSSDPTARNFIETSLKKYPTSSGLWYYLAILELSLKDQQKATENAKKAYLYNPYDELTKELYTALLNGTPINIEINKL